MPAPNQTQIKNAIAQQLSGWDLSAAARQAINTIVGERAVLFKLSADAAPGDATLFVAAHRVSTSCRVLAVHLLPHAALSANDANNATISVQRADGAGGAASTVASITTNLASGSWSANATRTLTLATSGLDLAAGNVLGFAITKAGTGVSVPAFRIVVELTYGEGL